MAGIYNGPARGGTRGGRDQFSWESVKSDKDREYYLGHSVKAVTGRWQKGKDVFWYTRDKSEAGEAERQQELAMVKQREEDLMMQALGIPLKPPRPAEPRAALGEGFPDAGPSQAPEASPPPPHRREDEDERRGHRRRGGEERRERKKERSSRRRERGERGKEKKERRQRSTSPRDRRLHGRERSSKRRSRSRSRERRPRRE